VFSAPIEGFTLGFLCWWLDVKKTGMNPLPDNGKVWWYVQTLRHNNSIVQTD